ncbi:MAG: SufE family protein [Pseudomonadales bacterium]
MSMPDLAEIRDAFAFFDDWEDKYRFVIELGRALPVMADTERTEEHLIRGCQSQVWLISQIDDHGRLHLELDSDAHIVRGLIAIVLAAYDGHTPAEVLAFDIEGLFEDLALLQHLSPTRGNGLRAMVTRIREAAAAHNGNC